MTSNDKCRVMGMANDIGKRWFEDDTVPVDMRIGALKAIREMVDAVMAVPEDDYTLDPLTFTEVEQCH